jgi:hypothetical protein
MAPGDVSGNDPAVRALERKIGTAISPSIHEWSAFTTDLRQAGLEHVIRDDPTLGWRPRRSALRLLTLGEGDSEWVVMRKYLADDDPPVECLDVEEWSRRVLATRRHTATTSEFALQHLIAYLNPGGGGFEVNMTPSPELLDELRSVGETSIQLGQQTLIEGEDLLIVVGVGPFDQPDGLGSIQVEIGPSRTNAIPKTLSNLAGRHGGSRSGIFAGRM